MIYQIFNMFGQAFSAGWKCIVDLVEASGMTKPVFIGLIVSLNVLIIVFGTLRARAFSGGDKTEDIDPEEMFERDVERVRYRSSVNREARRRDGSTSSLSGYRSMSRAEKMKSAGWK